MNHSSLDISILFPAYGPFQPLSYFFFTLVFSVYLILVFANVFLMMIMYFESSLHKPMYIFLLNLAVNGLIGSSATWSKMTENLISNTQKSSVEACLSQVFWSNVYATSAYTTLTVMAYDRYISICKPLQYHNIMTPSKVKQLLTVIYIFPISSMSIQLYLDSRLPLCKYTIQKLLCDNLEFVNLSCVKNRLINLYGVGIIICLVMLPFVIVVLSYVNILTVSLKTSKEAQKKALSTCSPHFITFVNFSLASDLSKALHLNYFYKMSKYVNGQCVKCSMCNLLWTRESLTCNVNICVFLYECKTS